MKLTVIIGLFLLAILLTLRQRRKDAIEKRQNEISRHGVTLTPEQGQTEYKNTLDDNSPYCKTCNSCGEDGCCSWLSCFAALSKDSKCEYSGYLNDAMFDKQVLTISFDIIDGLRTGTLDASSAVLEFDSAWKSAYDKVYKKSL